MLVGISLKEVEEEHNTQIDGDVSDVLVIGLKNDTIGARRIIKKHTLISSVQCEMWFVKIYRFKLKQMDGDITWTDVIYILCFSFDFRLGNLLGAVLYLFAKSIGYY